MSRREDRGGGAPRNGAPRHAPHDDRGAAGVLTLAALSLAVAASAAVLAAVVDIAASAARARTAADAAALAAAGTSPLVTVHDAATGDTAGAAAARSAARDVAEANGAELLDTGLQDWPLRVTVRVGVAPRTEMVRRIVEVSEAGATAGVRPRRVGIPVQQRPALGATR